MSVSSSFGSSQSTSLPVPIQTPQSDLLMQLSQMASQLGQQQYQWAQNEYGKTSQITDQAVSNYLAASQDARSLAENNLSRYTGVFQPLEDQLIRDANTYSSEPRVRSEMGAAESGVGQAFDAQRQNLERQLQSYGIDPSSGRYAELERANDASRAAAQAGAGQAARYNTENVGRQLRSQAIQVGQQYPAQAVNALNAETQALAGGVNAALGNANTGANLFKGANDYFGTAMRLPQPPVGQNTNSTSQQRSGSSSPSQSGNRNPRESGQSQPSSGGGSPSGAQRTPTVSGVDYTMPPAWSGTNTGDTGSFDPTMGWGADGTGAGTTANSGYGLYDPSNDPFSTANWGSTDPYADAASPFGDTSSYYDSSAFGPDPNAAQGDYGWGNSDPYGGGGYSGGGDYSDGGPIPDGPTTGGFVSQSLSPSQGQQTDDIPANLNANEFVIPRDVALWKGQEFFQNLIDKSRKARTEAPAQGGRVAA